MGNPGANQGEQVVLGRPIVQPVVPESTSAAAATSEFSPDEADSGCRGAKAGEPGRGRLSRFRHFRGQSMRMR